MNRTRIHMFFLVFSAALFAASGTPRSFANDAGLGTASSRPELFDPKRFDSVRRRTGDVPYSMSPALLPFVSAEFCLDRHGNRPPVPVEFNIRLTTPDDLSSPWVPGETHTLEIEARSSSLRLVRTPPLLDLLVVGGPGGSVWIDLDRTTFRVHDDPLHWTIPPLDDGTYRIHMIDRVTGFCGASEFSFDIANGAGNPTPTPSPSEMFTPTPTPTRPDEATPTSTPTPTATSDSPPPVLADAFGDTGPGTSSVGPPRVFTTGDFPSLRDRRTRRVLRHSPGIAKALGLCRDPQGGPVKSPVEFNVRIETLEDLSTPWLPDETRVVHLVARSSSLRFVETPPEFDVAFIDGDPDRPIIVGSVPSIPVGQDFIVPPLEPGSYKIRAFDRSTGLCIESDFRFTVAPGSTSPTPTPTARIPNYDADGDVDGIDFLTWQRGFLDGGGEFDLDGDGNHDSDDLFLWAFWWRTIVP